MSWGKAGDNPEGPLGRPLFCRGHPTLFVAGFSVYTAVIARHRVRLSVLETGGPIVPDIPADDLGSVPTWYFAVGGLETRQSRLQFNKAIELRRLTGYPSPKDLVAGLRCLATAGLMAHYSETQIQHELVFDGSVFDGYEDIVQTAGVVVAALRIRTKADVFSPAVCERSWQALSGDPARAFRVDQVMLDHAMSSSSLIGTDDVEWVARALGPLYDLTTNEKTRDERVATAVEAICSYLHAGTYRMMAAQLWVGVEALFNVEHETSYRVSAMIARFLAAHGTACRDLAKQVRKLYGERSKAVHGQKVSEDVLREHIGKVRSLLAQLLTRVVERGLPKREELDDMLFVPDPS